eukprot:3941029-Rhodomonas_salina.1
MKRQRVRGRGRDQERGRDRENEAATERDRERQREREAETDREAERQREREAMTDRQAETEREERERESKSQRQRQQQRQRQRPTCTRTRTRTQRQTKTETEIEVVTWPEEAEHAEGRTSGGMKRDEERRSRRERGRNRGDAGTAAGEVLFHCPLSRSLLGFLEPPDSQRCLQPNRGEIEEQCAVAAIRQSLATPDTRHRFIPRKAGGPTRIETFSSTFIRRANTPWPNTPSMCARRDLNKKLCLLLTFDTSRGSRRRVLTTIGIRDPIPRQLGDS